MIIYQHDTSIKKKTLQDSTIATRSSALKGKRRVPQPSAKGKRRVPQPSAASQAMMANFLGKPKPSHVPLQGKQKCSHVPPSSASKGKRRRRSASLAASQNAMAAWLNPSSSSSSSSALQVKRWEKSENGVESWVESDVEDSKPKANPLKPKKQSGLKTADNKEEALTNDSKLKANGHKPNPVQKRNGNAPRKGTPKASTDLLLIVDSSSISDSPSIESDEITFGVGVSGRNGDGDRDRGFVNGDGDSKYNSNGGPKKGAVRLAIEDLLQENPEWKTLNFVKNRKESVVLRHAVHNRLPPEEQELVEIDSQRFRRQVKGALKKSRDIVCPKNAQAKRRMTDPKAIVKMGDSRKERYSELARLNQIAYRQDERVMNRHREWRAEYNENQKELRKEKCNNFQSTELNGTVGETASKIINKNRPQLGGKSLLQIATNGQGVYIGTTAAKQQDHAENERFRFLCEKRVNNNSVVQRDPKRNPTQTQSDNIPHVVPWGSDGLEKLSKKECKDRGIFSIVLDFRCWKSLEVPLKLEQALQYQLHHLPLGQGRLHRVCGTGLPHSSRREESGMMEIFATILPENFFRKNPQMVVMDDCKTQNQATAYQEN